MTPWTMDEIGSKTYQAFINTKYLLPAIPVPNRRSGQPPRSLPAREPHWISDVHGIQMAEVEVNTETGEVKVIKMTVTVDAGHASAGPVEEARRRHGYGRRLCVAREEITSKTSDWRTFKFPTMKTAFDMEVIVRETDIRGTLGSAGDVAIVQRPHQRHVARAYHRIAWKLRIKSRQPWRQLEKINKKMLQQMHQAAVIRTRPAASKYRRSQHAL